MNHGRERETARPRTHSVYDRHTVEGWKGEIRLLDIHPGAWDDEIVCSMRVVSLNHRPIYRALSYVWGDEHPKDVVRIEDEELLVSPNLHAALRRMRYHGLDLVTSIFADALCINQSDMTERNHQVTLMGGVYSQCVEVIVWLGELEHSAEEVAMADAAAAFRTNQHNRHVAPCQCKQEQWRATAAFRNPPPPAMMAIRGASLLRRLARVKRCEDLLACHLFDTVEDMHALRFLAGYIADSIWFKRMWTVQEALLPRTGNILLGVVILPLDVLFDLATVWDLHKSRLCCRSWMTDLGPAVAPLARAWFFLGRERHRVQSGYRNDLFAMRIEYPSRRASLDVDLLYGLIGVTKTDYGISPNYTMPVEDVYTDASRNFLQAYPEYLSFWIFIYAPLKHRYTNMPSWAIDWTTLETTEYQNGRYTWTGLQSALECGGPDDRYRWSSIGYRSPLRPPSWFRNTSRVTYRQDERLYAAPHVETPRVRFHDTTMIMFASYVGKITCVGEVIDHVPANDWYQRFRKVVKSWRALILAHHEPEHIYQSTAQGDPFKGVKNVKELTWAMAWLKVLCAGHIPVDCEWEKISTEALRTILEHASHDTNSLLALRPGSSTENQKSSENLAGDTVQTRLYQKVLDFIPQLLEGKRIFMTRNGYLGFGNINTRVGDKV